MPTWRVFQALTFLIPGIDEVRLAPQMAAVRNYPARMIFNK
jgi:hypothetical protein